MNLQVNGNAAERYSHAKPLLVMKLCSILLLATALQVSAGHLSVGLTDATRKVAFRPIKGKVVDAKGNPLIGISVTITGKSGGSSTDDKGEFTINAETGDELSFSGVGFATQTMKVGSSSAVNITLAEGASQLEDMVVVGYGTQKRKDVTGAITSLKLEGSPRANIANVSPLESIQGAPGINIGPSTGAGAEPNIVIRGQNSITGSQKPLIVLDGVIFSGFLNEINMNDIASFDVLKDASSAAIYGSRSANGVLMITTKRGKSEKPQFMFNTYYGKQWWTNIPEMRKGEDYIQWRKDSRLIADPGADTKLETILSPLELKAYNEGRQIDWFDEITQNAPIQSYQLSVSGRSKSLNYYISGGFTKQNGVLSNDNFKRPNLTLKLENNLTDWLQVGLAGYYSQRDYSGTSPDLYLATYLPPYGDMYLRNDTLQRFPTGLAGLNNPYWGNPNLSQPGYYDDDLETLNSIRATGFVNIKIPFIKGLNYRLNMTSNRNGARRAYFHHEFGEVNTLVAGEVANPSQFLGRTTGYNQTTSTTGWVLDNLLTYQRSFGDHNLDVLAGYTREQNITEIVRVTGADFTNVGTTTMSYYGLAQATTRNGITSYGEYGNIGYIGRLNYNYKNRYFLTGNIRRDGASVLADGNKFNVFPGMSVAWTITEEDFMSKVKALDYLKLRASYGKTGSQGVDPYLTFATVNPTTFAGGFTVFGSTSVPTSIPIRLGNKELTWEFTKALNFGLDFAVLNRRITGTIDVYKGRTTSQLQTLGIPLFSGFRTVLTNIGEVENKGLEISLTSLNIKSKTGLNWETSVSFWINRNKLVSLNGTNKDNPGSSLFIGKSLGAVYDYTFDGIVQSTDVEYMATTGFKPGDVKFRDISGPDGKPDGKITIADRSVIGYAKENFNFNVANTFSYRNFSLFFAVNAIIGGGKNNWFISSNTRSLNPGAVLPTSANWLNQPYWMPGRENNEFPRSNYTNPLSYGFYQSRTFARLQDVNLSYRFNKSLVEKVRLTDVNLFVSAKNLVTFSGWTGLDPANGAAIGGNGGSSSSSANTFPPLMRSVTIGLNVGF